MALLTWLWKLNGSIRRGARRKGRRRPPTQRLVLERLEDRTLLAANLTIIQGASGSGTQDSNLLADGQVLFNDSDIGANTLSTGALAAVGSTTNIAVQATQTISFNDLGGTLSLQTGSGNSVTFSTATSGGGAISFATQGNTLATAGGSLTFSAGTGLTLANLDSGGGDVSLTAGADTAGNLSARNILTASSGNITLQATNAGGTVTQTGSTTGQAINVTATGNVTVDSMRGTTVTLTSNTGAINSTGSNPIQASAQLTLSAATGITVNTLATTLQATNSTSGDISITQAASPQQALTTAGTGVRNLVSGGLVSIINLGNTITVASGAPVLSNNGEITLAATDFTLQGAVNSGTNRTNLTNSTAGRQFDLGTDTAGKIGLTSAEIDNVTAGTLRIGSGNAGAITISANIAPAGTNTLSLINAGNVTQAGTITENNLRVDSGGMVSLDAGNDVDVLAGAGGNGFAFTDIDDLIIGTVDFQPGVVASNASAITIIADNLDIQQQIGTAGSVTLRPFTSTAVIDVGGPDVAGSPPHLGLTDTELGRVSAGSLRIGETFNTGGLTVSSAITRHAGYDTLALVNSGPITQSAPLSVANLDVLSNDTVTLSDAGNDVDTLAGFAGGSHNFSYSDANALTIGSVVFDVGVNVGNDVALTTGGALTINQQIVSVTTSVTLTAGGAVTEGANGQIVSPNLLLLGTGPYTLTNPGNDVNTLAANVTGAVSYTDFDDLTIGSVGGTNGVVTTNSAIAIATVDGALTVSDTRAGADVDAGNSTVALTAGSAMGQDRALTLNANAGVSGTGGVTLTADNMSLGAAVNAGTAIAALRPFATNTLINLGGADAANTLGLTDAELDFVTAGVIVVGSTAGDLTVTAQITPANSNQLELVTGAGILDGNTTGADLVVTRLGLTASTGIGVSGGDIRLDVSVSNLEALTDTGGIDIANTGGTLSLGGVNGTLTGIRVNTSGNIRIENNATIQLTDDDGLETVLGGSMSGDVTLLATGATSDVTSTVDEDAISAPRGSIFVTAGHDILFGAVGIDHDNDVRASNDVTFSAGRNITIDGFADVASDDFGQGTGGSVFFTAGTGGVSGNINITNNNGDDASVGANGNSGGDVTLTVMALNGFLNLTAPFSNALFSNSGNVTVNADQVMIATGVNGSGITANNGIVTIQQFSAAHPIDLGTAADTAGTLGLSDAELDRIFTPTLRIGDAANAGSITVSAAITGTTYTTLHLRTGGGIVDGDATAGDPTIVTVNDLALEAAIGIGSADDLDTAVSNLAASNTGGNVQVANTGSLTLPVGGVDGLVGVTNTAAGNIFLSAASPIVVDSAVSDTGGGNITLVTSGADGSITVTTNGSITASGGNGNILLDTSAGTSGQSAILINDGPNAADLSASGTGNITLRSNDAVTLGANAVLQSGLAASGGGTITLQSNFNDVNGTDNIVLGANSQILTRGSIVLNADPDGNGVGGAIVLGAGSFLGAPGGGLANTIILIAAGDITLSDLRATNLVSVTSTGGAIIDGNDPPTGTNNITAATVNLNAATGIGSVPNPNDPMATAADAPIEITASTLSFSNSTSGDVQIVNLSGDLSASGSNSASGGTINLTVQNGNTLTVNASNISSNNGDITLSADDMTITGTVNAGTAIVTLQQAGTTTQNIDLGTNSAGNLGLTDAELGQVTASILRIGRTDNGGSISVTAPITTHAGYDTLSLRTGGGGILEPNAGLAPAIQVTNLAATSNGGGIILNGLNQVSTVALSSGGGGIDFLNSLDLSIGSVDGLNGVDSGGGGITLATVNGNITVTNTPAAIDVNGSGVSITASTTAAHTFTNSAGAAVSGASVSITATNMDLQAGSSVTSLGRTTLAPPSFVPIAIDLGGADGATTLGLTAAELNTVTASTLQIGNGNSGSITVTAAIAPTNVPTLDLETGGGISESAAGDTITVPNLAIRAVNAVTLDQANDVTTGALAANVSGANQSFNFTDANDLTIGTADGLMGITTNGGTIVVTTTNGNLTVNNNVSAGAANINLIAGGTDSTFTNNAVISNSGGLQITVIADRMALNGTPGTSAFTADNGGDVILEPFSAGRLINLGSTTDTAANTLELSNAELGTVTTASAIVIGNASAGDVTVSAPISINSAQVPALEIQTGGGVTNNPTTATLTVTDLDVQAGNAVNLTGANAVSGALAGVVSNAGQGFTFNNAAALDINSAGGINGITTNGGTITVSTTNGDLTVDQAVAAGAAAVNLTAGCNPGADNLLMNNNAITGNSATLTADRMALDDGTINVGTGATNIVTLQPCTVGRPVNLDNAAGDPNGELRLSDAELDTVTAGILRVGNSSAGALTVKSAITDSGSYANLSLLSAGNITETGTGSLSVPAPGGLAAQGSVVNLNSANNAIVNVAGIATGNATPAFNLVTSTSLNVVTVDGVSGIQATNATSSGISLSDTAANTAITVSQPVVATNGDITFTFDNMAFLAAVNAGTRRVTLQPFSSGQLIDLGGNDAAGTLGLSDAELDRVTAGTLQVGMSLSGDITVSNTIDAESHYGTLSLATGGGIVEMTNGKLQVTNLALQAAAGIGSAVALATQATNLAASNSTSGNIQVSNTGALTITTVDSVAGVTNSASGGTVSITNAGGGSNLLTVAQNVTANGAVTLTAGGSLTVQPGTMVSSSTSTVTLNLGADNTGSTDTIAGTVNGTTASAGGGTGADSLRIDFTAGASLPNGLNYDGGAGNNALTISDDGGGSAHTYGINATSIVRDSATTVNYISVQAATVTGGNGSDTFNVTPSATTTFTVNGRNPTPPVSPGDTFNLNLAGTTNAMVTASSGPSGFSGTWTFGNRQPVNFSEMETLIPPPLSIVASDASAAETGALEPANPGQFTVTRSGDTASALTVFYTVSGTATNGVDYAALSGSVVIAAGQTSATLDVNVINDSIREGPETVVVTLTANPAYVLTASTSATVVITDNETGAVPVRSYLVVGSGPGNGALVQVRDAATGQLLGNLAPYPGFGGTVSVAAGDINGDGIPDIITGAGANAHVKAFDGATGALLRSFIAFPGFTGGVTVAAGDVNGDGFADIITGAGANAHVKVFDGATGTNIVSFFAYQNVGFFGAVNVGAADVDGDGKADLITGTGAGTTARVRVFRDGTLSTLYDFTPYDGFAGGVFVGGVDLDNDGRAEIITGAGIGAGPHVEVFDGGTGALRASFLALDSTSPALGVSVGGLDRSNNGRGQIVVGDGPAPALVPSASRPRSLVRLLDGLTQAELDSFFAFGPTYFGGVFVAGR